MPRSSTVQSRAARYAATTQTVARRDGHAALDYLHYLGMVDLGQLGSTPRGLPAARTTMLLSSRLPALPPGRCPSAIAWPLPNMSPGAGGCYYANAASRGRLPTASLRGNSPRLAA